jgi:hypothetical protein
MPHASRGKAAAGFFGGSPPRLHQYKSVSLALGSLRRPGRREFGEALGADGLRDMTERAKGRLGDAKDEA